MAGQGIKGAAAAVLARVKGAAWAIKRVTACVVICTVLAILPVFVNSLFGYVPLVSFVALIMLSGIYIRVLKRSLTFEELSASADCQRGQSIDFIIRLTNRSVLFFPKIKVSFYVSDLFGSADTLQESTITLAPLEVRDFIIDVRFDHIGRYSAGLRQVVISDPLGLFRATLEGSHATYVAVTPRVYDMSSLETITEETPDSLERVLSASENSMDYATVREYVPGDPLKAIHWKLSSREPEGIYLTRLYESYSNPSLDIILDFCAPAGLSAEEMMSVFDALLETAFSLCNWAEGCGMACHLVYRSKAGEPRMLDSHMDAWSMLEACSDMPQIGCDRRLAVDAYEMLAQISRSQTSSNIAVVSSRIEERMVQAVVDAKGAKKHLLFFGLLPHAMSGQELADYVRPLRALGGFSIASYTLSNASELDKAVSHVA